MVRAPKSLTELLADLRAGDRTAVRALVPHVYGELRRIAARQLAREQRGSTLSPTGLVHECYVKLIAEERATFQDRAHLLAVAAQAMRRILVDHARARQTAKRGGARRPVTLGDGLLDGTVGAEDILVVEDLLGRLEALHGRQAQVVAHRFYGGLTDEEIAHVLAVSVPTVRRDWRVARAWLVRELGRSP